MRESTQQKAGFGVRLNKGWVENRLLRDGDMTASREIDTIVRQAHAARAALRQARLLLAGAAQPGTPAVLVDPSWDWARRVLTSRAPRLRTIAGVIGYALGTRQRGGTPTADPCIIVYVRRKLTPPELRARAWRPLPGKLGTGPRGIEVDVVELGDLERHAASPAFERPAGSLWSDSSRLAAALMHQLAAGERVPAPGVGPLHAWRPTVFPGDAGVAVRLAGLSSGLQHGVLASPLAHLPGWGLDPALLAHVHSTPGDSGSVLVDSDDFVLGFLVGRATCAGGSLRVFRPAAALALPAAVAPDEPRPELRVRGLEGPQPPASGLVAARAPVAGAL